MVASHEYTERILTCFDRAAEANLHTPSRQGNLVAIDSSTAEDILITGDLHGHRRNFNKILRLAALDANPRRHVVFQEVCHGGPVYSQNGGCMSHTILEDVARLKTQYPERIHFILGNHELAELTDYPIQKNRQLLNLQFRLGLQQMYGPNAAKVHDAARRFLQTCPLAVRLEQGIFISHSTPANVTSGLFQPSVFSRKLTPDDYAEDGDIAQLVWGRDYREENAKKFAEMVGAEILINGHEPCYEGFLAPNSRQIILDCCDDRAACLILPIGRRFTHEEIMHRIHRLDR